MKRIGVSEVPVVRERIKKSQGDKCAICGQPFTKRDIPVLDHDHDTGIIRGVLHASCNGAEGKIKIKAMRGHAGVSAYLYLIGLGKYLARHEMNRTHLIHPTHLTEAEKREKRNKKARLARARKKRATQESTGVGSGAT